MVKEFKEFVNRGNVVDLAVAVVIGVAFKDVVTAFTEYIVGGVLGIIGGKPNFNDALILTVNNANIRFGAFVTAVVNFLLTAFVVFLFVKALNKARLYQAAEAGPTEVELLTDIRDALVDKRAG